MEVRQIFLNDFPQTDNITLWFKKVSPTCIVVAVTDIEKVEGNDIVVNGTEDEIRVISDFCDQIGRTIDLGNTEEINEENITDEMRKTLEDILKYGWD